jgi:pseudaminic acid synthase
MGMGGDKKKIQKIFLKNKIIFCYCISEYPLEFNKINWKKAVNYDGFSDHTMGITAPILFTILKKQKKSKEIIIEKHVKLQNSTGPDASTSIDTTQLSVLISHIRLIEKTNL